MSVVPTSGIAATFAGDPMDSISPPALCLAAMALSAALTAQTTRTVGPAGAFPDIQAAVAASTAGDVVLVSAGTYPPFTADRAITVRAEPQGAAVHVARTGPVLFQMPSGGAGARALLSGIDFDGDVLVGASVGGLVVFEDCVIRGRMLIDRTDVALQFVDVLGGGSDGIAIQGANLSISQSSVSGGQTFGAAPAGIRAGSGAQIQISHCTIEGGAAVFGTHSVLDAGVGMILRDSAQAWISDSTVTSFPLTANRTTEYAIDNGATHPVQVARTTLRGGPTSRATVGALQPAALVTVAAPGSILAHSSLRRGTSWTVSVTGSPGQFAVAHGTLALAAASSHPLLLQPEWGFAAQSDVFAFVGLDAATGQGAFSVGIPNLPSLLDASFWVSAWSGPTLPVALSAPVGGLIY